MARTSSPAASAGGLHRALGLRDLVLLYVACIISLSSVAQVAQFGLGSMLLFVFAIVCFLVPSGLMVAELGARMPEEGGLYHWTRQAFGELHGFLCAWCYYVANIVWLPTVCLLVTTSALFLFPEDLRPLAQDSRYNAVACLAILWGVTFLNYLGLERAKWVQNVGAVATWAVAVLLVLLAALYLARFGVGRELGVGVFIPDLSDTEVLGYFALVAFCFGGLELGPVLAGEIRDPAHTVPRAIFLASVAVGVCYLLLTLALVFMAPEGGIDIINGIAAAFSDASRRLGLPWLGYLGVAGVALSTLGLFGAWLAGGARIPLVVGIAHYLPGAFARIHPRHGSPTVALVTQGLALSVMTLAAVAGSTVKEAFLVLLDMAVLLYFLPFLYLFGALPVLVRRGVGAGLFPRLAHPAGYGVVAIAGFMTTLLSMAVSVIPTRDVADPGLFLLKVLGGAVLLCGAGVVLYLRERRGAAGLREPR